MKVRKILQAAGFVGLSGWLCKFWVAHKFFIKESKSYVGNGRETIYGYTIYTYSFKNRLYFPIAWVKFMWYCWKGGKFV